MQSQNLIFFARDQISINFRNFGRAQISPEKKVTPSGLFYACAKYSARVSQSRDAVTFAVMISAGMIIKSLVEA